jgi:hypothetical protein
MKRDIKKLQLKKKTITRFNALESKVFMGGQLAATSPLFSCRNACGPTQLCVTINICPTITLPTGNCPL